MSIIDMSITAALLYLKTITQRLWDGILKHKKHTTGEHPDFIEKIGNNMNPVVYEERCVECSECISLCPAGALRLKDRKNS